MTRSIVHIGEDSGVYAADLSRFLPASLRQYLGAQTDIPSIARDPALMAAIDDAVQRVPTHHDIILGDARELGDVPSESVHLVVTSPPYWTLKEYNESELQMGSIQDYDEFLQQLDRVWRECMRVLVPGGRIVCVVGDVLRSRRANGGRHEVVPLHASIQEHCRAIGFDNLAPIIWYKIGNAKYEAGGGGFLGKPYEPNAVIKNDIEYILFERKSGGYRSPSWDARLLSVISSDNYQRWFQQIWTGVTGASTREHPAPFPSELAERLIRMFSFVGDTVLDPFLGTGTTSVAAARWGRSSIGVEVDPEYFGLAERRLRAAAGDFFRPVEVVTRRG